jgi:hypothetical protein
MTIKDTKQDVQGRTNSPTFPTCHLFEVLENGNKLSEPTLTSFYSI